MKDGFAEKFILYSLRKKIMKKHLYVLQKYKDIQCLLQEICTNLCERNCKVVYKYEGIWTCEGCVGKLWVY